jgi:hypothetical protein
LLEYFDFANPHFRKPPRLPTATIDPSKAAQCADLHPGVLGEDGSHVCFDNLNRTLTG